MAVYVDKLKTPYRGMKMSHMLADTPAELHAMAERVGLRREWFQNGRVPHYDLCQAKRRLVIESGAIEIGRRETVALIRKLGFGLKASRQAVESDARQSKPQP
jgi:hypothetical protein